MQFPVLSLIIFTPIITSLLLLLLPDNKKTEVRVISLAAATVALILSIWVYFSYDVSQAGYQFIEKYSWLPAMGISYHVGIDGMSAPLIFLTGIVMFTGVLISWELMIAPENFSHFYSSWPRVFSVFLRHYILYVVFLL